MRKLDNILQEALVKNNLLKKTDIQSHFTEAQSTGKSLKEYLILKGVLTERQILVALAQVLNTKVINFNDLIIDKSVLDMVKFQFISYYNILPITFQNNLLTVAAANPIFVKELDELRSHLNTEINFVLAEEHRLKEAIEYHYKFKGTINDVIKQTPQDNALAGDGQKITDIDGDKEEQAVKRLVNQIILEAYKKRATDIHVEPYRNKVRFRYRIDGVLVDANLPEEVRMYFNKIISRIKVLANLDISDRRLPQDGSAVVKTTEQHLDLRVSTMPTPRGESIVIRILPTKVMLFSLEKLGFNPASVTIFRNIIKKPHGIVFITGPTGSGKTTTLYACLNEINSSKRKIITIEDPVEYEMDGITQVQVNPKIQFTFATGLRSILRHDPDIIMVGEVRDPETAEIAIKTALTGHLVFSTLHTNDAASGITRLIDMGTEPYLVASSVEAFIAQRLVRVICPKCKGVDNNPMPGVKKEIIRSLSLDADSPVAIYKGAGCEHCNNTGYYGRVAIYEILTLTDNIRAAILEKPRSDYIKRIAMRNGLKTLRQNGWKAVLDGITTPDEVINVTVKDEYLEEKIEQSTSEKAYSISALKDEEDSLVYKKEKGAIKTDYRQRIYPRTSIQIPVRYKLVRKTHESTNSVENAMEMETISKNLSASGISFNTEQALAVGAILDVKLQLNGNPAHAIGCMVRVCRVEPTDKINKSIFSVATYFLNISYEDQKQISNFIEKNLKDEKNETTI